MKWFSIIFKLMKIMTVIKKVLNINCNDIRNSKFREEPRAACNSVKLSSQFETLNHDDLRMKSEFDKDSGTTWN